MPEEVREVVEDMLEIVNEEGLVISDNCEIKCQHTVLINFDDKVSKNSTPLTFLRTALIGINPFGSWSIWIFISISRPYLYRG